MPQSRSSATPDGMIDLRIWYSYFRGQVRKVEREWASQNNCNWLLCSEKRVGFATYFFSKRSSNSARKSSSILTPLIVLTEMPLEVLTRRPCAFDAMRSEVHLSL